MNGYKNERMELKAICAWLDKRGMGDIGEELYRAYQYHAFVKNGLIRKDVVADIFKVAPTMFREMECEVSTYVELIRYDEAHVD